MIQEQIESLYLTSPSGELFTNPFFLFATCFEVKPSPVARELPIEAGGSVEVWISPDAARQHHSPYTYGSNNPVNRIDPDGNQDVDASMEAHFCQGGGCADLPDGFDQRMLRSSADYEMQSASDQVMLTLGGMYLGAGLIFGGQAALPYVPVVVEAATVLVGTNPDKVVKVTNKVRDVSQYKTHGPGLLSFLNGIRTEALAIFKDVFGPSSDTPTQNGGN